MALIKCSECGREISDQAETCPNCGSTTKYGLRQKEQQVKEKKKTTGNIAHIIGMVAGLIIVYAVYTMYGDIAGRLYTYAPPFTDHELKTLILLGVGIISGGYSMIAEIKAKR